MFTAVPPHNWYPAEVYADKFRAAGPENVSVVSIREHVYLPLMRYVRSRLDDSDVIKRVNGIYRRRLLRTLNSRFALTRAVQMLDYVVAVADKPGS